MQLTATIVNLILCGVLGAVAIVIVYQVVQSAFYTNGNWTGPPGILEAIVPLIAPIVGVAVIVMIFMLLSKMT